MIKTRLVVALFIWLFVSPTLSIAQQGETTIRAGEHPTYSRLVIPGAFDLAWELRTFGREATLMIPTDATTFLTDGVFDRIPRTRLLNLESETISGDTFLRLKLACDCEVSAKVEGANLILDISDKENPQPQNEAQTADGALSRPTPRPESAQNDQPKAPSTGVPSDLAERLISQLNKAAEQGIIELNEPTQKEVATEQVSEPAQEQPSTEAVSAAENGLQPIEETLDGLAGVAERIEKELLDTLGSDSLGSSIRIQVPEEFRVPENSNKTTTRDTDNTEQTEQVALEHCIDDELLDVAYWADERPYSEQVADLQSRVFGEFDEPDSEAVLQLARFYIFFGLGTETTSLLSDLQLEQRQSELLRELANTVEGKTHVSGGVLDKAAGCPGAVALWRTAALDTSEKQPLSNPESIIELFSELPIHVRRIIGPRLVQSFITRGQQAAANQVFAIVDRAAGYHGDAHELRRADILLLEGEFSEAEAIYWRLVYENSEVSAQAAIVLVQSLLQREARLPPNVLTALEALAFEFRGDEIGKDLLLTTIQAKAGSNAIQDAISISLQEIDANPDMSEDYYDAIDTIISKATVEQMGAAPYVKLVFNNLETIDSTNVTDDTKTAVADEIMKAGLPNSALRLLETIPEVDTKATRATISKASVKLRNFEAPITLNQLNPNDPILATAAAQALSILGQHQEAVTVIDGVDFLENTPATVWRAGEWERAAKLNTGPTMILASFMANRQTSRASEIAPDLTNAENAVVQTLPIQPNITLKYAKDVQLQSSTVRSFLSETIEGM